MKILSNPNVFLGFDLSQYTKHPFAIKYLAMLAQAYPNSILFSCGLRYKTDLTTYGGDGYRLYSFRADQSWIVEQLRGVMEEDVLSRVTLANQLRLLDWKEKLQAL